MSILNICHASELAAKAKPITWLWPGVLAHGAVTLLTSTSKTGKTTLLSVLLDRISKGGKFAGIEIPQGRAVVLSEESEAVWLPRKEKFGYLDTIDFSCRPFDGTTGEEQWAKTIEELAELPPSLIVYDSLTEFLPPNVENYPSGLRRTMSPLHAITNRGHALVITHHPNKHPGRKITERGCGELTAFVDIKATLGEPRNSLSPRERLLEVKSRPFGISTMLNLELNAEGTDYRVRPPETDLLSFERGWTIVQAIIRDSPMPPTRKQILNMWLQDFEEPSFTTLRRWLERAEELGLVRVLGSGLFNDAFTYHLVRPPKPAPAAA